MPPKPHISAAWRIAAPLILLTLAMMTGNPAQAQNEAKDLVDSVLLASDRENPDEYAIYAMNPDGSGQTRLSKGPGAAFDAAWSPDHKQIIYVYIPTRGMPHSHLMRMKTDGSEPTLLLSGDEKILFLSPSWSPDGKKILFTAVRAGGDKLDAAVGVVDADGANQKQLAEGVLGSWSPDGKQILFSQFPAGDGPRALQVMDADGTHIRPLKAKGLGGVWSPDGKQIAFTGDGGDCPNLFVMDADETHLIQLTKDASALALGPVWSSDGKQLLFTRIPKEIKEKLKVQVCRMDADGRNVKPITAMDSFLGPGVSLAFLLRSFSR